MQRNLKGDGVVADVCWLPKNRVGRTPLWFDTNFVNNLVAFAARKPQLSGVVAGQGAVDCERYTNDLAGDAKRRQVEAQQFDVWQPRATADRQRENRNATLREPQRRIDRGRPGIPVSVGGQDDPHNVVGFFNRFCQRCGEIGVGAVATERLHDDVHLLGQRRPGCRIA